MIRWVAYNMLTPYIVVSNLQGRSINFVMTKAPETVTIGHLPFLRNRNTLSHTYPTPTAIHLLRNFIFTHSSSTLRSCRVRMKYHQDKIPVLRTYFVLLYGHTKLYILTSGGDEFFRVQIDQSLKK